MAVDSSLHISLHGNTEQFQVGNIALCRFYKMCNMDGLPRTSELIIRNSSLHKQKVSSEYSYNGEQ